ncbi:hypothetical protein ElyMa_000427600 [Elysia marginata]|uniref:Uncharacterized protein n=1 Tax=Elysia marginata TaxID=1093978 RepID=A0AAV4FLZ8_9GAST|nr:hypothetical protein ElyMa_000427600 [Elysia marginata]
MKATGSVLLRQRDGTITTSSRHVHPTEQRAQGRGTRETIDWSPHHRPGKQTSPELNENQRPEADSSTYNTFNHKVQSTIRYTKEPLPLYKTRAERTTTRLVMSVRSSCSRMPRGSDHTDTSLPVGSDQIPSSSDQRSGGLSINGCAITQRGGRAR